jgi:hypothetical protein
MVLLGDVHELEVQAERPDHVALLAEIEPPDGVTKVGSPRLRSARSGIPREESDALLLLEESGPLLLDEHSPQDLAEQANVAPERRICVGRGRGLPLYSRTDSCSSLVGRTV